MKKLNRKGFTLIELLAVIVVLGIVLVVTIPNIAVSINNNKLSALNTLSKEVAKWYDETVISDKLSTDKVLGSVTERTWYCLNNVNGKNVAELYGLSSDDIKLTGSVPIVTTFANNTRLKINGDTCSAIRVVNGSAEVLLIGELNGKYAKNNTYSYALSTVKNGNFLDTIGDVYIAL